MFLDGLLYEPDLRMVLFHLSNQASWTWTEDISFLSLFTNEMKTVLTQWTLFEVHKW